MKISQKKKIGYRLYGLLYRAFSLLPVDGNRAYFIMTHDSSAEGNCGVMKALMEKHGFRCDTLTRKEASSARFIFKSAYKLARSRHILCDNTFLPLACLKLRKGSTLTQLWHGTGTIKKFGQHVNRGELFRFEARCGRNITNLIVSSEATREIYAGCFGVPQAKVQVLGLPRTDALFKPGFSKEARARFEKKYPAIKGRRLVLYAPTFRDDTGAENVQLDTIRAFIDNFLAAMPEDVCLGLRLHPYVSSGLKLEADYGKYESHAADSHINGSHATDSGADAAGKASDARHKYCNRVFDLTHFRGLNTLLGAADVLITDYSSIIFEYSLLKRPMLFYAYDLEHFENSDRGFYRDYRSYVPGPVFTDADSLLGHLSDLLASAENTGVVHKNSGVAIPASYPDIDAFIADSFAYTDGKSAERVLALLTLE